MSKRYKRTIQAIVIHHMGDGLPPDISIEKRWNPNGYEYPSYDFGVEYDGRIKNGRPLTILGAHTRADKAPRESDEYWYNKNGIGIGLAGDFTKYPMPREQYLGLVNLTRKLMDQYRIPAEEVKAHKDVTYTLCPGTNWDFARFKKDLTGGEVSVQSLVIYGYDDWAAADILAHYLQCPTILLERFKAKPIDAEVIYVLGGKDVPVPRATLLSGANRYETMQAVLDFIKITGDEIKK